MKLPAKWTDTLDQVFATPMWLFIWIVWHFLPKSHKWRKLPKICFSLENWSRARTRLMREIDALCWIYIVSLVVLCGKLQAM